jgi:hypothetical protein
VGWLVGSQEKERELDDCLGRPISLSLSHCDLPLLLPKDQFGIVI